MTEGRAGKGTGEGVSCLSLANSMGVCEFASIEDGKSKPCVLLKGGGRDRDRLAALQSIGALDRDLLNSRQSIGSRSLAEETD